MLYLLGRFSRGVLVCSLGNFNFHLQRFNWVHWLNTLTSTYAFSTQLSQKPCMTTSRQVPSLPFLWVGAGVVQSMVDFQEQGSCDVTFHAIKATCLTGQWMFNAEWLNKGYRYSARVDSGVSSHTGGRAFLNANANPGQWTILLHILILHINSMPTKTPPHVCSCRFKPVCC